MPNVGKEPGPKVPADIRRRVLVEAGHRCAIPTCRSIEVEVCHIVSWKQCRKHEHSNLIALCRNCHVRADRGEIDRKSIKFYKSNSRTSHDRFSQLEIDVLFEANASRSESIKWPPYMKLLIKRICDAGLVALVQPNRDVSIGGMRADPDDLCITEKGRKYIRGLGSSELSPFLGRRSEELLRLASVEYYSSNRQAATRLRPITAGYTRQLHNLPVRTSVRPAEHEVLEP